MNKERNYSVSQKECQQPSFFFFFPVVIGGLLVGISSFGNSFLVVISLRETWYGHVGIVEEVNNETIIISEMNHLGPWKVNRRELKKNDYRINGYIYP